jgi:hypothetical protein
LRWGRIYFALLDFEACADPQILVSCLDGHVATLEKKGPQCSHKLDGALCDGIRYPGKTQETGERYASGHSRVHWINLVGSTVVLEVTTTG